MTSTSDQSGFLLPATLDGFEARLVTFGNYSTGGNVFQNEEGRDLIPVKKGDLLNELRKNRESHHKTFNEAIEGYRQEAIAALEQSLTEARKGKRIRRSIDLIEPIDQTKDYDRAIRALEMTTLEVIHLTSGQFAQWVMDDWNWKAQFVNSTQGYIGKAIPR